MKRIVALSALGVMASALFAQGLNAPASQTKEDWEEINFEFDSSILSDGYPSLLRLADLLSQHRDFKVAVTGHTDYVGSNSYNDKLALERANTVKRFLVKYGANDDQVSVAGDGKRQPEVDNRTKEGRFMNRRVTLRVTDGQGRLVKEGGISDVLPALQSWLDKFAKKQQECCDAILKRLDKLDDILAAVNSLQGENAALKGELADQRNQINTLRDQIANMPKPVTEQQAAEVAHKEATNAVEEIRKHNQKFSLLGISVGPTLRLEQPRQCDLRCQRPFLFSVRRRRHACRAGAGRVHIQPAGPGSPVRSGPSQPVGECAGRRIRQFQISELQAISEWRGARPGRFPAGLYFQTRPDRLLRHAGLQELRGGQQPDAGARRFPADLCQGRQPVRWRCSGRGVG